MKLIMEVEDLTGYSMFMAAGTVKEDLVQCSASIMMGVHKGPHPGSVMAETVKQSTSVVLLNTIVGACVKRSKGTTWKEVGRFGCAL
ncbi:hypothetical protein C5167_008605 [Papaver somniferum]|uniref:Uncharacterized protein n=1 Tax=Papaver somniferum TaxID=3469 RepID=A0A4Y7JV12_PAPSO|nr:hypothetical protein C5167_008605 [Papaver somniferum]